MQVKRSVSFVDRTFRSFIYRRPAIVFIWLSIFFISPVAASDDSFPEVQREVLPNGLVLLISEDHSLPFMTMRFLADAGARRDPRERAGLANLVSEALLLGTPERTAQELNEQIDFLGASLSSSCNFDYATVDFKILTKNWAEGIDIFLDVITRPTFPEDQIRRETRMLQSALAEEEDQPGIVAEKAFQRTLFDYSPYGHAVNGTIESLNRISRQNVRQFYGRYYRPNNGILVIVGDVNSDEIRRQMIGRLRQWQKKEIEDSPPQRVLAPSPQDVTIDKSLSQANIILGHGGIARDNPDFHAVIVMNQILGGGGFTSRLMQRIRVEKGLAYSVGSFFEPRRYPGAFQIVLQTKNESAREAVTIAREEMRKMQRQPVGDQELTTAKSYLIGSFPLRYASQSGLAGLLAYIEYYGLGLDYFEKYAGRIRGIGKEDVQAAARKYLKPDEAVVALVADLEAAGMQP